MNLGPLIRSALAVLMSAAALPVHAQNTLEILDLRHRTAEQVLPTLQPLVEPGGTLTGQGNRLIVRTSPANLAELRRALEAIDRPARRLQISVRFDDGLAASSRALGTSGRIGSGGSTIEIRARDSSTSATERVDQSIQVLEGSRATIYAGESRPIRERRFIQTPAGVVSQEVTEVQDTRTGFDVVPRVSGDQVQVDVLASRETGPGAEARVATSASGRLGEWFSLGALVQQGARASEGLASSASRSSGETRRVWIKVDALP